MKTKLINAAWGALSLFIITPFAQNLDEAIVIWLALIITTIMSALITHFQAGKLNNVLACGFGLLLVDLLIRFSEGFSGSILALPRLFFELAGIGLGYVLLKRREPARILSTVLITVLYFLYTNLWQNRLENYMNYGNASELVNAPMPYWVCFDSTGKELDESAFRNKLIYVDFWNSGCVACIKGFPTLQEFYEKHETDSSVMISAVHIQSEPSDRKSGFIQKKGYTFPNFETSMATQDLLNIYAYPTVMICQNNKVLFKGLPEHAMDYFEYLLSHK